MLLLVLFLPVTTACMRHKVGCKAVYFVVYLCTLSTRSVQLGNRCVHELILIILEHSVDDDGSTRTATHATSLLSLPPLALDATSDLAVAARLGGAGGGG